MSTYIELTIEQGATFSSTVDIKNGSGNPWDLTDHTVIAQLKKSYYSTTSHTFIIDIAEPATIGTVALTMGADVTANLAPGRYVYDMILVTPSETVIRIFEGTALVTPGVSFNV